MTRPLDGILVLSLEQAIAVPYCTRQLADLGARVVKIERPDGGDFARAYDTRARGLASHFVWTNRSKESPVLDLKQPDELDIVNRLIARADIFVQNLAQGAADRLGLASAELRTVHPRLITCAISGYGKGGSWEDRKAYDLLIQAEREEVAKAGISIGDIAAGTMAFQGILAAIIQRGRTGKGDHIEVSMLEAMAEWMGYPMYYALDGASPPPRAGAGHGTIFPYGPYRTADGTILFGLQNDREWAAFARVVLQRPELAADERFKRNRGRAAHRDEVQAAIEDRFSGLSTADVVVRLAEAGIATARVNDMGASATCRAGPMGRGRDRGGALPVLKPLTGEGWEACLNPIPEQGEHNAKILAELGLPADQPEHRNS